MWQIQWRSNWGPFSSRGPWTLSTHATQLLCHCTAPFIITLQQQSCWCWSGSSDLPIGTSSLLLESLDKVSAGLGCTGGPDWRDEPVELWKYQTKISYTNNLQSTKIRKLQEKIWKKHNISRYYFTESTLYKHHIRRTKYKSNNAKKKNGLLKTGLAWQDLQNMRCSKLLAE